MKNKISRAVVKRLPKYHECLTALDKENVERTSSSELGELLGATASQVRQDFNNFGGFGQQGYGYKVKSLLAEIEKILGLDREYKTVILGCGNLGSALANFTGFQEYGYKIAGLFDVDRNKIGREINGITVRDVADLDAFLKQNKVDIVYLTTTADAAQELSDIAVQNGVKAIWNFSHTKIVAPNDVHVESVHLIEELFRLSYYLNSSDE